jgi:hypothetical protein
MQSITLRASIGQDGKLTLALPQFRDVEVEIIVREIEAQPTDQFAIFDIPSLHLPAEHSAHTFLSREELYDDDER